MDGESLGRSFGESLGALAGRKLGRLAVGQLLSKLPFRDDGDGNPSLLRRITSTFVVVLGRTLSQPQFRDPIEETLREYVEKREAAETLDDAKKLRRRPPKKPQKRSAKARTKRAIAPIMGTGRRRRRLAPRQPTTSTPTTYKQSGKRRTGICSKRWSIRSFNLSRRKST